MGETTSDKRQIILNSARELFWKHGFRRISVEEICSRSGISKMTFYRYFPNKIELAKTLFNIVVQEAYDKFRIIMNEDTPAELKIQKILILKFDGTIDISQEFLTDFYSGKESGLSDYVLERTNAMWQIIIGDFRIAQQEGIFRDDLNLEFFFGLTQMFTQVFNNQKFLKMFTSPQEMIMETAKLLLYGISPRK